VYQVPLTTNPPSGEAIHDHLLSGQAEQTLIPNHVLETYTKGQNKVVESASIRGLKPTTGRPANRVDPAEG